MIIVVFITITVCILPVFGFLSRFKSADGFERFLLIFAVLTCVPLCIVWWNILGPNGGRGNGWDELMEFVVAVGIAAVGNVVYFSVTAD